MTRELPARIHRYRILHELGIGSMGRVYLAEDPNIGRRLALKVLSPERLSTPEKQAEVHQRFLYEARAAGSLDHPGIVTVFDADSDPLSGDPYLAMEYVDGFSLRDLLERQGPPSIPRTLQLLAQVARALGFAHQHGVIHRDIKPANLLIREHDGIVKVVDFGIAKLVSPALTQPGRLLGTPFYMAPEHLRSEPLDGRADLFSLGVVLYECLTGHTPFQAEHIAGVHQKILQDEPPPLGKGFPQALEAVVQRALAKDPDQRFVNGVAFAEALEGIGSELPTTGLPRGGPQALASFGTTELPAPDSELLETQPSQVPPPSPLTASPTSAHQTTTLPAVSSPPDPPRRDASSGKPGDSPSALPAAPVPERGAVPSRAPLGVVRWGLLALALVAVFGVALWMARSLRSTSPTPIETRQPLQIVLAAEAPPTFAERPTLQLPSTAPEPPSADTEQPVALVRTSPPAIDGPTTEDTAVLQATLNLELRPRLGKARVVVTKVADDAASPLFDQELQAQGALRWRKMMLPPLQLPAGAQGLSIRVINTERGVDAEGILELDLAPDSQESRILVRPQRRGAEQTLEEREDDST